ncbi:unnamed protein product [Rotaria sordida]|uniref:Palmitoyltransferase n=1 Tax=Rotaria sordida TaxID=392033 RepID=A0A813XWG2_9BILA|nr:unnamed protein product [Rotaria sordida]
MKYNNNNNHFSPSTNLIDNENLVFEPLLSSNQYSEQSTNDLLISEEQRDFQSVYFTYISRIKNLCCTMTIRTPSMCCCEVLKWIPVIFILGLVGWSYYAYVVQMCIFTIDSVPKKVIYLCIYHILLILILWSYYQTVFAPLVGPPRQFYIGEVESASIATIQTVNERRATLIRLSRQANLPLVTRHFDGSIRYCSICKCVKPDRAHHCSVCEQCVLRYDHHCPWTNSCISYGNYKFFILFLGWALIFCTYVAGTSLQYFILFWQNVANSENNETGSVSTSGRFHLLFLFFIAIIFAVSVSSLFFYHLFLIGKNRTTVESHRAPIFANGPQKDGFDLGCKQNIQEILGTDLIKALIPINTTQGDGIHYQVNSMLLEDLQERSRNPTRDVVLPLDTLANPINNDRNYLLSSNTNRR